MGSGASNAARDIQQPIILNSYDSLRQYAENIDDSCVEQINLYKSTIHFNPRKMQYHGTVVCFLSEFVHQGYIAAIIAKRRNKIEISLFKDNTQIAFIPSSQQSQAFRSNVVDLRSNNEVMLIWDHTNYFKLKTTNSIENTAANAQVVTQQQYRNKCIRYGFFTFTYLIGLAWFFCSWQH